MFPPLETPQAAPPARGGAQWGRGCPAVTFRPPTPRNFYLYGKATDALDLFFGFGHILAMMNILAIPDSGGRYQGLPS